MTKKTITYYEVRLDKHYYTVTGGMGSHFIPHVETRKRLNFETLGLAQRHIEGFLESRPADEKWIRDAPEDIIARYIYTNSERDIHYTVTLTRIDLELICKKENERE